MMVPKWLRGGAKGLKIQNIKTLLRGYSEITLAYFDHSQFVNVVFKVYDETILQKFCFHILCCVLSILKPTLKLQAGAQLG